MEERSVVGESHGYTATVDQDVYSESPDEWRNDDVFLVSEDDRHLWVPVDGFPVQEIAEKAVDGCWKSYRVFPVFAYIHSGIALSLGRGTYPFTCPWDTSCVGFVVVRPGAWNEGVTDEKLEAAAQATVDEWNQYLAGDVWGYSITDPAGETIDSCGGFYGHEYAVEEAMGSLTAYIEGEIDIDLFAKA